MFNKIIKPKNKQADYSPLSLSIHEKQFYLALYNSLPVDYSLAFHSDVINLNSLIMKDKTKFSKGCLFLEKFNNQVVDFIVLDKNLQGCAVVLFDHPEGSKVHTEFYQQLIDLQIPVFTYKKEDDYSFKDLLMFIKH
tara:strand:- start:1728 stop:2138 length:411 start_codon:yes stop_codon:yes gene_type:complete